MDLDDRNIRDILLKGSYVTETDIRNAETFAGNHRSSIVEYFLSEGLLNKSLLGQAIAESLGMAYADLAANPPSQELILKIPLALAKKSRVILLSENKNALTVTTDDPKQAGLRQALTELFPKTKITIAFSLPEDIDAVLSRYRKPLETRFSKIIAEQRHVAPEIIEEILSDALSYHASDIHFEPQNKEVVVRFRVDGVLQEAGRLPGEYYENVLNRIKVQSRLRIDEHFAAQDGSMRCEGNNASVDLRTSVTPTVEGEKVVLRILASYVKGLTLEHLGLSGPHQAMLETASRKPFGMILITGPTGSGKTTTLYGLLKLLNNPDVNITTIEDPVEYKMLGVNQIQVNPQTNLTFAKGLRSIVRQDPDIILVGEIRDNETVEIAINAALTGHLLLSSFHANDASTAIPRLLDMGAEPFLLASTLELIIAQRLVRKICEHCRHSLPLPNSKFGPDKEVIEGFIGKKNVTLYKGKGCSACGNTGYKGRTAIFELIVVTPELRDLVLTSPSSRAIWKLARQQGSLSLFEDGIEKVKNGITTLQELLRVAQPPAKT